MQDLYNNYIIGGCGIKINQHRNFIGEIGYFLDEKFWGKGFATKAVKILEKEGFKKLNLKRIEILIHPKNMKSRALISREWLEKRRWLSIMICRFWPQIRVALNLVST